jgi:hypothetical protein
VHCEIRIFENTAGMYGCAQEMRGGVGTEQVVGEPYICGFGFEAIYSLLKWTGHDASVVDQEIELLTL